jgi:transcription elongation factor GreA
VSKGSSQVTLTSTGNEIIRVGSRVRVLDDDGEDEFAVVADHEADAREKRVSADSPVGRALLGHAVGDRVVVRAPGGQRAVSVVEVRQ